MPPAGGNLMNNPPPLLEIKDLSINFPSEAGIVSVVDDFNLSIGRYDQCCLLGESGCGKTVAALAILNLLPPAAEIKGEIIFEDRNLLSLTPDKIRQVRGKDIAIIFETPASCLNPVMSIGKQIAEAIERQGFTRKQARKAAIEILARTGVPDPEIRSRQYPHQFSGGMLQRVMIAMALAAKPKLLIADEPTTALDPTVQMQIIELMQDVVNELSASLLLITHDLDVAAELCANVAAMYAGQIVETGPLHKIFKSPRHPYVQALMKTFDHERFCPICGSPPPLTAPPQGCRFHPRCPEANGICSIEKPLLQNGVRCSA
ncbi:ABC transporter ATP-binding protein [Marinifilum sp. JC120]|nr:ABC transporter ATP-binding protein [Marinifilum sp. JC120]